MVNAFGHKVGTSDISSVLKLLSVHPFQLQISEMISYLPFRITSQSGKSLHKTKYRCCFLCMTRLIYFQVILKWLHTMTFKENCKKFCLDTMSNRRQQHCLRVPMLDDYYSPPCMQVMHTDDENDNWKTVVITILNFFL